MIATTPQHPSHTTQTPTATWVRWAALCATSITLLGCPFGPSLPVEEQPNYPPVISEEFVRPLGYSVQIQRNQTQSFEFSVQRFLDINEAETLHVYWLTPGLDVRGPISSTIVSEAGPEVELYRGLFTQYQGTEFFLDPCNSRWINETRIVLTVLVSDGALTFQGDTYTQQVEDRFIDTYTWTIRFEGICI